MGSGEIDRNLTASLPPGLCCEQKSLNEGLFWWNPITQKGIVENIKQKIGMSKMHVFQVPFWNLTRQNALGSMSQLQVGLASYWLTEIHSVTRWQAIVDLWWLLASWWLNMSPRFWTNSFIFQPQIMNGLVWATSSPDLAMDSRVMVEGWWWLTKWRMKSRTAKHACLFGGVKKVTQWWDAAGAGVVPLQFDNSVVEAVPTGSSLFCSWSWLAV